MNSFSESKLSEGIKNQLENKGFSTPTEIQSKAIPVLLEHEGDFVARSATGTGKTIAFGAPLLSRIITFNLSVQAVVLVPTRELCEQVGQELSYLADGNPNLKVEAVYGGVSLKSQVKDLQGAQVIVATPGRMLDLVERGAIKLSLLKFVVFDEADEMLLTGFRNDIDKILNSANRKYNSWLFSATMPDEINSIIRNYLNKDLIKVTVGKKQKTNLDIDHQAIEVSAEQKQSILFHLLNQFNGQKGIIFCRTKSGVQKLYKQLSAQKIKSGAIHGDLPQGLRNKVMDQFREGHISILVATDVASRGLDIEDISFVIQYHVPDTTDIYTHRSGRTSRAGNTGTSITLIFKEEKEKFTEIYEELSIDVKFLPTPTEQDQILNNAILWARRVAKQKPIGEDLSHESKEAFKGELKHLSKDEILEKLLAKVILG